MRRMRIRGRRGQAMTEYVILIVAFAIALGAAVLALRRSMEDFLDRSRDSLCSVAAGSPGSEPP